MNRALTNGYNLEAMFIEYALMEDRTESVLHHAELWDAYEKSRSKKGRPINIDSKIKYIKKQTENKSDLLNKYFADDLLDNVLEWEEERNRLIHALLKQQFEHNEIRDLAEKGKNLVDTLRTRSTNYNRAIDRKKNVVK